MSFDPEKPVLQNRLRFAPWMQEQSRRLPGIMPLDMADWLQVDEAYAGQLALKAHLLATCPDVVHQLPEVARPAAEELLELVLDQLRGMDGFAVAKLVTCPDGRVVEVDRANPLITLSQLIQEDLIIMMQGGDEHVLAAGLLCFPASWSLREKLGRALVSIHIPVHEYTPDLAKRVQRLFDAIRVGRPLWRANALLYQDPQLHQPRSEHERRPGKGGDTPYVRSEKQSLIRLPETQAVVFSIHTTVINRRDLTPEQERGLIEFPMGEVPA